MGGASLPGDDVPARFYQVAPPRSSAAQEACICARQLHPPDFVAQVLAVLDRTGADPQKLKLELTESLLLDDVEDIIAKMHAFKACGVGFSLDDFGTGYSSLFYLKRLILCPGPRPTATMRRLPASSSPWRKAWAWASSPRASRPKRSGNVSPS